MSLKKGERMGRTNSTTAVDIIGMNGQTPIPHQLDKFWASVENKWNLQLLVPDMIYYQTRGNTTVIVSPVVVDDEVLPAKSADGEEIPELLNCVDEA